MLFRSDGGVDGVPHMMGNPLRVNGEYFGNAQPAPVRGAHTREVLAEFGFSAEEIRGFLQSGAAFAA